MTSNKASPVRCLINKEMETPIWHGSTLAHTQNVKIKIYY